jgi:Ni/Co efflux regulator RcnB
MKRIVLLTALAAMMAAAMALSGVAQAKPITIGDTGKKCFLEAVA